MAMAWPEKEEEKSIFVLVIDHLTTGSDYDIFRERHQGRSNMSSAAGLFRG